MAGSLSFLVQCPLLKVGHAQYRQLNLELEFDFHKKTKKHQTIHAMRANLGLIEPLLQG